MSVLSRVLRRVHMYLALFLMPWMLMYALSTMAMNHREWLGKRPPAFETEGETTYGGTFPADAKPREMARQILSGLGMDGASGARWSPDKSKLIVNRLDLVSPKRLTFTPADGKLTIEREVFRGPAFLERMHRRRGYQAGYKVDDAWAFSVDLTIVAMIFWVASGLWMWWEMKRTRRWGAIFGAAGVALFALFVVTI